VDDGTGICSSEEEELRIKRSIQKFYKIKEKNTTQPFKVLGILVIRDMHQATLKLSQADYIDGLLQQFDMSDCNPVLMPIDKGSHLQDGKSANYEGVKTYQALIGSLTYVVTSTCLDIGYITQFLSQANKDPRQ